MKMKMEQCRLLRNAQFVYCPDCRSVFGINVPWKLSSTKFLHERGTGHKPYYVRIAS